MLVVRSKTYTLPSVDEREVLRYAACQTPDEGVLALLSECERELDGKLSCKVCWSEFPLQVHGERCEFGAFSVSSFALAKRLAGCEKAVAFCATVGIEVDRLIAKYGKLSPVKALLFQAIGAERIEALCEQVCEDLRQSYGEVTARFSPGYADLSLESQEKLFRVLQCEKQIGVCLNNSFLMSPSKSVTAIVGIGGCRIEVGCDECEKVDCAHRRR